MVKPSYDRYSDLRFNGWVGRVPPVKILPSTTDRVETYHQGKSRLDLISYKHYNNAGYGWLILMANPSLPSLEFNIADGTELRIPFPLEDAVQQYIDGVARYGIVYGF